MVGGRVFTQGDVDEGVKPGADIGLLSLGISAHAEDSHNMQRFACHDKNTPPCYGDGPRHATGPFVWDEGDYHGTVAPPKLLLVLVATAEASSLQSVLDLLLARAGLT